MTREQSSVCGSGPYGEDDKVVPRAMHHPTQRPRAEETYCVGLLLCEGGCPLFSFFLSSYAALWQGETPAREDGVLVMGKADPFKPLKKSLISMKFGWMTDACVEAKTYSWERGPPKMR